MSSVTSRAVEDPRKEKQMAGIKGNNHQVFRAYYKRYSAKRNDNDLVFLSEFGEKLPIDNAKHLTVERYLYEIDALQVNALENYLSTLESDWARRMYSVGTDRFEKRFFDSFLDFAFYTALRTTEAISRMRRVYEIESKLNIRDGRQSYLYEIPKFAQQAKRNFIDSGNLKFRIITQLSDGHEMFLLTSDRPVIFGDEVGKPIPAELAPFHDVRSVVFPFSSNMLFVAYSGRFPSEIVDNHNRIQAWSSKGILVANSEHEELAKEVISNQDPWCPPIERANISGMAITNNLTEETFIRITAAAGWEQEYYMVENSLIRLWSSHADTDWHSESIEPDEWHRLN